MGVCIPVSQLTPNKTFPSIASKLVAASGAAQRRDEGRSYRASEQ